VTTYNNNNSNDSSSSSNTNNNNGDDDDDNNNNNDNNNNSSTYVVTFLCFSRLCVANLKIFDSESFLFCRHVCCRESYDKFKSSKKLRGNTIL
jgi:hypothetical protein